MMPPKHRIFPRLSVESFETEIEKAVIKAKWERIRVERSKEEHNKALESGEVIDIPKTYDESKKLVDFRNLKATDLKYNKRIKIPEPQNDEEEIRMNHVKTELKEVFIRYMREHCDVKGNMIENNLTVEQVKAIKDLKAKMEK